MNFDEGYARNIPTEGVSLSRRARPFRWISVVLSLVFLDVALVGGAPADATGCVHDDTAFDAVWSDHYWVGEDIDGSPECDKNGRFTVAIQRINTGDGCTNTVDGQYGAATQTKVRCFQLLHSLTDDGLVGSLTWAKYDDHIDGSCFVDCVFHFTNYSPTLTSFKQIPCCSVNWQSANIGYGAFETFDRFGYGGG